MTIRYLKISKRGAMSVVLVLAILVGGAVLSSRVGSAPPDEGPTENVTEQKLPNVAVQVVQSRRVEDILELTGSVEPWEAVTLSAEISGKIEWLGVEEGDTVVAGQELARINTTSIRARLAQAQAEQRLAEQEYKRVQALRDEGISSSQEYDQAVTNREAAIANVRLMEIELAQSTVRAEFDGVIDQLYKEQGEFVSVGADLVRMVQVDRVKLVIGLPEREVLFCAPGDAVAVMLDAYPKRKFTGTVFRVATSAEASTRTFPTEITLDNSEGVIKPGMIGRAQLVRRVFEQAITVPIFTVVERNDQRVVFVERDGVAQMRQVEIGFFQDDYLHITEGLYDGDRLVVIGQRNLRDGQAVNVQERSGPLSATD